MIRMLAGYSYLTLLLVLFVGRIASAQANSTGQLTGTVLDQQGSRIPGALVLAENTLTGSKFRAVTNGVGVWKISSVPTGNYTVSVRAQGFKTSTSKEINLYSGAIEAIDTILQIGLANTIVVTASKHEEEVINAPATVTVIPEMTVQNSPSPNLGELLRSVPGINVAQTSAREFNITSRAATGVFAGTQLALIDGRTIYHDDMGYLCWDGQATNLNELKQVEVIRGPASAIWGANAMNGIINIITKSPREMLGSSLTFGIGTFDRSGGGAETDRGSSYYINASHAQVLNNRWSYKLTGGAFTQDPFARPQGPMPNAYHTPYPLYTNKGTTQPNANARLDYDLPDGRQHLVFSGGYGGTGGIIHSQMGPYRVHNGYMKSYGKLDYYNSSLKLTGYINLSGGETTSLLLTDSEGWPIKTDGKNFTYHVEISNSLTIYSKHLISYGGSFRHNYFNLSYAPEGKNRDEGGVYLQDEFLLSEHFRLIFGARIDKFSFLKSVSFSPRITFMAKPTPSQTFRVSYNRAYVAPSVLMNYLDLPFMTQIDLGMIDDQLAEHYYSLPVYGVGNEDLKKQSLNAYEVGYTALLAKGLVSLGAAFYINDSKNGLFPLFVQYTSENPPPGWPLPPMVLDGLIDAGMGLPSMFTYQNLSKVRNKGMELNVNARFNRYFNGYANYSWQSHPESEDFDVSLLNIAPAHRFNSGMDLHYKRYLGNVSVGYVDSAEWNDVLGPLYSGTTEAYTIVNTGVGIRWGGRCTYTAMLKVSNLSNNPIQNHVFGDILKRQINGEFKIRF